MTKIAVVGTGYVGLANAVLLAQHNEVVAYDTDEDRVAKINRGEPTIEDAELALFLSEKPLNLVATTDKERAYQHAELGRTKTARPLATAVIAYQKTPNNCWLTMQVC